MIRKGIIPVLALGHGINDLLAGYLVGTISSGNGNTWQTGMALFMYNLLAFGGQYPAALWLEKIGKRKQVLIGAFIGNLAAISLMGVTQSVAIILAGTASAIYHVAGGAYCARENKAFSIGIFASPGVAGLIAGGYFAWTGVNVRGLILLTTLLFCLLLWMMHFPAFKEKQKHQNSDIPSFRPDRHDWIMILLLTVIALRSAVWNIFQLIHEQQYEWLIAIAIAACAGKILGGWLADRIGWKIYVYGSLSLAAPLVSFCRNEMILFCIGIGLLQSGIPATTALLIRAAKGKTERGIGLSFGTAIIIGGIIFSLPAGIYSGTWILPLALVLATILLFYFSTKMQRRVS